MTTAQTVSESLWQLAGMPADPLSQLGLADAKPLLPTSFHVAVAAQSTIANAALGAEVIGQVRGAPPQRVSVDRHAAERECTGWFSIDGVVPTAWAPLSGLYPCADGYVRIHANFDHHRDGALRVLGVAGDGATVSREQVTRALAGWNKVDFETAAAEAGLVVSACRSFAEWDRHPQAAAIATLPLFTLEKIGEADPVPLGTISDRQRPLEGIRVLDLTRILAGPVCGRTLAAYGADVMLVNSPTLPNIDAIADTSRGKRSALVDLTTEEGREQLVRLTRNANLFVQGYRPGGLAQLGFSPEEAARLNPGIVYISLSAYGHTGPWSARRGFDSLVQTATGFNVAEGEAAASATPRALPVQILDFASGFLMAFAGLAALRKQQVEGGSWHVRVSLAQTGHWLRSLGRLEDNLDQGRPDLAAHAERYTSGYGELMAMPHAAQFSRTPAKWTRAANPPGTDAPAW